MADGGIHVTSPWRELTSKVSTALLMKLLGSAVIGGFLATLFLRFTVLEQVHGQDLDHGRRMSGIEARVEVVAEQAKENTISLRLIDQTNRTLLRAECSRWTQAQQQTRDMACPSAIYRGAAGLE